MNQNASSVESDVVAVVQSMYAAFGRGDIRALLSYLSSEVDWRICVDPAAPGAKRIPDFRSFRGKEGVQAFFSILDAEIEFHAFRPLSFLSNHNEVAARVYLELTVRSTGYRFRTEAVHSFIFDVNGKVTRFVEYTDTLGLAGAWDVVQAK